MRLRTTDGRCYSAAARDVLAVSMKLRAWRIAGWRIAQADDLLAELDALAATHPRLVRRLECLRSALLSSIVAGITGVPEGMTW